MEVTDAPPPSFLCKSQNIHRLKSIHFIVNGWKIPSWLNRLPYKRAQKEARVASVVKRGVELE